MAEAVAHSPDLIILDTVSRAFTVRDENSNAEITNGVMKPLDRLAAETGAAILFCHHVGKAGSESGGSSNRTYRARGASAFEGMCQAVIDLDVKKTSAGGRGLLLSYRKVKDVEPPDLMLQIDPDTRRVEMLEGEPVTGGNDEEYQRLVKCVTAPMKTRELITASPWLTDTTRKRYVDRAIAEGKLKRPQRGCIQPFNFEPRAIKLAA
jgi:hypothetical protein